MKGFPEWWRPFFFHGITLALIPGRSIAEPNMKRTAITLLALAIFFPLTSEKCAKDSGAATTGSSSTPASIIGTRWNLATVGGESISLPEGKENPHLSVAEDNRLSGFGGCNRLMGSVKLDGKALSFPGVGGTKMFCAETQALENAFLTALRATNSFTIDGDKLTLLDGSTELATLVKH